MNNYEFKEIIDECRSVEMKQSDSENRFLLTWDSEKGTFRVRTTVDLSIEAVSATHALLGKFLLEISAYDLLKAAIDKTDTDK